MRFEDGGNQRQRIAGATSRRGYQSGFPTWGTIAFGAVFVASGTGLALVGEKVIPVDPSTVHAPYWVLTVIGLVFALSGLMVWGMAARQYGANRRRLDAIARRPGLAALADYPWDTSGFRSERWAHATHALFGSAFLTLFLSVFNYLAFFSDEGHWVLTTVTVIFDIVAVFAWWEAFTRLGRALKFGASRLAFVRFPYAPGETVALRWHPAAGIGRARDGRFTLRCVAERYDRHDEGQNPTLVHEAVWSGTWHLDGERAFDPRRPLELAFEVPSGLPSTSLSSGAVVFWELEVALDLPGFDFVESYLVPVYGGTDQSSR